MNLSIKNVPEPTVERLRERAARRHRSLQGELLAIVESAAREDAVMSPLDVLARARRLGLSREVSSIDIIRADRDDR